MMDPQEGKGLLQAAAHKLTGTGTALAEASQPALRKAARTADSANGYVREHPWTAIGLALAAGALAGYLARRR